MTQAIQRRASPEVMRTSQIAQKNSTRRLTLSPRSSLRSTARTEIIQSAPTLSYTKPPLTPEVSAEAIRLVQTEVSSDVLLTKDDIMANIAVERDSYNSYGVSLERTLNAQVEKLQANISSEINQQFDVRLGQMSAQVVEKLHGVMSALANEFNVRADNLANAQQADISNEIRQQLNARMDRITIQVVAKLQEVMSEEVQKFKDRMEKLAIVKQTDTSMLQELNAKIDQMSAQVEKNTKDILELNSMSAQIEKNTGDILKMEGALESVDLNEISGVTKQINHLSAITESYQVQLQKVEEHAQKSTKSFEELFQETERLQQNDIALQLQHDYLQQQVGQNVEPLDVNQEFIRRITALEEGMWQLSSKENQNEGFNREVHQLFKHLREHIESYDARIQKLEVGGLSVKGHPNLKIKLEALHNN